MKTFWFLVLTQWVASHALDYFIYVDRSKSTPAADCGATWETACKDLYDAFALIQAAPPRPGGYSVRVAQGVYKPRPGESFVLPNIEEEVVVSGGYAGVASGGYDTWDPRLYPTVFSGDQLGNDPPDWSTWIFFASGDGNPSYLADNSPSIFVANRGSFQIIHATITGGFNFDGSGIRINSPARGSVSRCILTRNYGGAATGRFYWFNYNLVMENYTKQSGAGFFGESEETLSGNVFYRNYAFRNGGGVYLTSGKYFFNNVFLENVAEFGAGGAAYLQGTVANASNLTLVSNTGKDGTGGIHFANAQTLFNSVFLDNQSTSGSKSASGPLTLDHCAYQSSPSFQSQFGTQVQANLSPVVYSQSPLRNRADPDGLNNDFDIMFWPPSNDDGLSPLEGGPLVGAGLRPSGNPYNWQDINGNDRHGPIVDIGAYNVFPCLSINLTAVPPQGGSVSASVPPQDGSCYTPGTELDITATPASTAWEFSNWLGINTADNPARVTIGNTDLNVSAYFRDCYYLHASVQPEGAGTISYDPPKPANSCYPIGTTVTLTASDAPGFQFIRWGGNEIGTDRQLTVQVDRDKSVTAHFAGSYTLTGKVTEIGTTFGIPNAFIEVDANGKKVSAVTDAQGNYTLPAVPLATSGATHPIRISRGCYAILTSTVPANQQGTVIRDFSLATSLGISVIPTSPVVGRNVSFLPANDCPEVNSYLWSLDVNNPPSPTATTRSATHIYATTGVKHVTLNVTRSQGLPPLSAQIDVTVVDCQASPAAFTLLSGPVGSTCALGLNQEPIGFSIQVAQDACDATTVQSVEWRRNGVVQPGTGLTNTVAVPLGNSEVSAVVFYSFKGQSSYKIFKKPVELTQDCGLDPFGNIILRPREIRVEEKRADSQGTFVYQRVEGEVIVDEDGGGAVVKLTENVEPDCECRHTVNVVKITHKAPEGDFVYTNHPVQDLVLSRGVHQLVLYFTVSDVITGTVTPILTTDPRTIRVLPPDPEEIQSRFGCGVPPTYDHAFWNNPLPAEELDFSEPFHEIEGKGTDFAGTFDEGLFKYDLVAGDFVLTAGLKSWTGMQAGLMLRQSGSAWSPMVFFGREGASDIFLGYREKFRNPTVYLNVPHDDNQTCLRMERTGDVLTFATAQGQVDPADANRIICPENGWQAVESAPGTPLTLAGWTGLARLGLAAAGNPDVNAVFNDLAIEGEQGTDGRRWVNELTQAQTIINTGFSDGNLVSNWSFENVQPFFNPSSASASLGWEMLSDPAPYEGRFFARLSDKAGSHTVISPKLPVYFENDGKTTSKIRLQCQVRTSVSGVHPRIVFHSESGAAQYHALPDAYPTGAGWASYSAEFSAPDDATVSFQLELANATAAFTGNVDIENVQLIPVMGGEQNLSITAVTFADGLDRGFQSVRYGKDEDFVKASILDGQGRFDRQLPAFTVARSADPASFRGVKRDPLALLDAYFAQDDRASRTNAMDWIDNKPSLSEFQEGFGTKFFERSPLGRLESLKGRLASQDVLYEYKNDFIEGLEGDDEGDGYANHTVRLVHSDFDRAKGGFSTREEHRDPYGDVVKIVDKGKKLDAAGTCEGQPVSDNKNCTDLISTKDLDIFSRTWLSVTPLGVANPDKATAYSSSKVYNTWDEIIATDIPASRGSTEAMHDALGHLRFFRDGNKKEAKQFLANSFDAFGRKTKVFLISDNGGTLWDQMYADDPDWPGSISEARLVQEYFFDAPPATLPAGLSAGDLRNLKGRMTASFAYGEKGTVAKYYSYDERGGVENTWLKILNLPLQKISTHFNLGNKTVKVDFDGRTPALSSAKKTEEYLYDELLRTKMILGGVQSETPAPLAEYTYWPDGKTRYATLGAAQRQRLAFRYDATERLIHQRHEWLPSTTTTWQASSNYEQKLRYNAQGNVDLKSYRLPATVGESYRAVVYSYDHFKRLLKADFGKSSVGWPESDTDPFFLVPDFDARFAYNEDGAIAALGYQGIDPAAYHYESDSHRLSRVGEPGQPVIWYGRDRSETGNFLYDLNGNLIAEKSAKRKIIYDYRNMPLAVIQCVEMVDYECDGVKSQTEFVYDDSGNRVAKIRRK